jgi:protein O-mannosyl-transferase
MTKWYSNRRNILFVALVLLATLIVYLPAFSEKKQFTNWDDPDYVINQPLVRSLSADTIQAMFSPSRPVSANYHPLTMLSLAVNYHFSELDPSGYFYTNVLLHLLNTFLVFVFIYLISKGRVIPALITSLLFGIHPLHVESVAWLSERKDVLYTFFFLLSLIFYVKYITNAQRKFIIFSLFLFLLSCLSKAMAVVLPLLLLLIDYLHARKFTWRTLLEKVPFFLIALLFGILALSIQSKLAMNESNAFPLWQKFFFSSHSLMMYAVKLAVPLHISAFYPYPDLALGIPLLYYLSPVILLAAAAGIYMLVRQRPVEIRRQLVFGICFFVVCLLPVLQLIAVGGAIMADRYTYVSSIGLFFLAGMLLGQLLGNKEWRIAAIACTFIITGALGFVAYRYISVWNTSESLWTDVIENSDQYIEVAYLDRGQYYAANNSHDKALADFKVLADVGSEDDGVYVNLGNEYVFFQKYNEAINMYTKALELNPANRLALLNRASARMLNGQFEESVRDFDEVMKVQDKYYERAKAYREQAQ